MYFEDKIIQNDETTGISYCINPDISSLEVENKKTKTSYLVILCRLLV